MTLLSVPLAGLTGLPPYLLLYAGASLFPIAVFMVFVAVVVAGFEHPATISAMAMRRAKRMCRLGYGRAIGNCDYMT